MGRFNRDNKSGGDRKFNDRNSGGRSFGGGGGFNNRGAGNRPQMHQATCSKCGESCELPFRPSGDRPVFCSTCFGQQNNASAPRRDNRGNDNNRGSFGRSSFGDKQMHEATCAKCGQSCQVPFQPRPGKDVFCNACFGKTGATGGGKGGEQSNKQMEMINVKLDKILKILAPNTVFESAPKKVEKVKKEKEIKKEKPAKKTAKKKK
jgi:CxxC-x17-CxxC domain-containing protein